MTRSIASLTRIPVVLALCGALAGPAWAQQVSKPRAAGDARPVAQAPERPGWVVVPPTARTPEQARAYIRSRGKVAFDAPIVAQRSGRAGVRTKSAAAAPGTPTSVAELARALRNDPDLIYQHVRNHVETYPVYGVQKGAVGALIDGTGTAFDQALLLRDLLRAAGYGSATLVSGRVRLPRRRRSGWAWRWRTGAPSPADCRRASIGWRKGAWARKAEPVRRSVRSRSSTRGYA